MKRCCSRILIVVGTLPILIFIFKPTEILTVLTPAQFQGQPKTQEDFKYAARNDLSNFEISESEVQFRTDDETWFLNKITSFATAISQLTDKSELAPGPIANTLFGGLVKIVREFPRFNASHITSDPRIQNLRPKLLERCSAAEYLLELNFGTQVILQNKGVEDFLYFDNYKLLIEFELKSIAEYIRDVYFMNEGLRRISQVVIIGSGPLPLTSVQLLEQLPSVNTTITNYDQSKEAVTIGSGVLKSRKLSRRISSINLTALQIPDLRHADLVYLAALAGRGPEEKKRIVDHLYKIMKPGSILVTRSAFGLRTLLYHQLTEGEFGQFERFREFHPVNKVIINSIAVGTKLFKS